MNKRISFVVLMLLLTGMLWCTVKIRIVKATGTIYINADGSISPTTAPISTSDHSTYVFTNSSYDALVVLRDNIVINGAGYSVQGSGAEGAGIDISSRSNVTVKNISVIGFDGPGVLLNYSYNDTVSGCVLSGNSDGIEVDYSSNDTLSGNNAYGDSNGIFLDISFNNTVSNNTVSGNSFSGIWIGYSSGSTLKLGNSVHDNIVNGNEYGFYLLYSSNNTISKNYASNETSYGFYLDTSSNNNVLSRNVASTNTYGIYIESSTNNNFSSNIAHGDAYGIWFDNSSGNIATDNDVSNGNNAFILGSSSGNTLTANNITGNYADGLYLGGSVNNTVSSNNFTGNGCGISVIVSSANIFYHNDFIHNTNQTSLDNSSNTWDDNYPYGGNFWSDYNGTDLYRGYYQNVTGSDGIGDTSYPLTVSNSDHYPLMGPSGSTVNSGFNVTVFPSPDVGLIFSNVTASGNVLLSETLTIMAPTLANLVGEYYNITTSLSSSGKITVRIIFNGSGMTQQQKSNLTMVQYTPIPGDVVVPLGTLDIKDVHFIAVLYGTNSTSPNWNPLADLNGDGKVDIRDVHIAAVNYGKTASWTNITTYVDTTNNVIYGTTTHFSFIGIH